MPLKWGYAIIVDIILTKRDDEDGVRPVKTKMYIIRKYSVIYRLRGSELC